MEIKEQKKNVRPKVQKVIVFSNIFLLRKT